MPVRGRLRAATLQAHARVDLRFSQYDLGRIEQYRPFLQAHDAVLPGCERVLRASGAERLIADWPCRVRADALAADLGTVGGTSVDGPALALLGPAAVFGMVYVLEGSRLGGSVLARRVLAGADPRCRDATRYLRHGEGLRLWPSFLAALEASAEVRDDPEAAVASAVATFGLFERAAGAMKVGSSWTLTATPRGGRLARHEQDRL